MLSEKAAFGMIGLGVMGRNFLLNVSDHGYPAVGLDKDPEKVNALNAESAERKLAGTTDLNTFVNALQRPRSIMLLVPAGAIVDQVIEELIPVLDEGDLIIDGGNSHFEDTNRRQAYLESKDLLFLGMGVSGGAKGARKGPSMMPGGNKAAFSLVKPILEAVSAKVDDDPCVAYMGRRSAGHFVKMVHNGIEYGLMQLIAEAYQMMRQVGQMDNASIGNVFKSWNAGRLGSFLIEITSEIFDQKDPFEKGELIDFILDKAKQKGTGKWTSQVALDLGIPIPTIDAAVTMRGISSFKGLREELDLSIEVKGAIPADLVDQLEKALYLAFLVTYTQGFHLIQEASRDFDYAIDQELTARIWRGGCIIRAKMLEDFRKTFRESHPKTSLLESDLLKHAQASCESALQYINTLAIQQRAPMMAFQSALQYIIAYTTARLPLNVVQAQRDHFGSHTYQRTDREGVFHTEWGKA